LFWQIHGWLWGITWVVGALIVLAYSIGISSLDSAVTEHSLWLRRQQASATFDELEQRHQSAMLKLIHEEFSKIYPVLFWFMLLGPGGALLYRLSKQYRNFDDCSEEDGRISNAVIHALEWLPVRITGLAFAVVGVFANSTRHLLDSLMDWETPAEDLLFELAELAITVREAEPVDAQQFLRKAGLHMKAVQELLHRVLLFWIALIAIVTVVGWG
jgi:AmpE protein